MRCRVQMYCTLPRATRQYKILGLAKLGAIGLITRNKTTGLTTRTRTFASKRGRIVTGHALSSYRGYLGAICVVRSAMLQTLCLDLYSAISTLWGLARYLRSER